MLYNVITDWDELEKLFDDYGREGHFSSYGYQFILDWYEGLDENKEVYVPDLDESFDEYGDGCFYSLQDFINDYGYYYPLDEYFEDNGLNSDEYYTDEYYTEDDYIRELVDTVSYHESPCFLLKNGNVMIVK